MKLEKALKIFEESNLMQKGHFLLTSGRHSDTYMQCARLFEQPKYSEMIAKDIAEGFADDGITVVVGPAMGGIILAYEVSRALGVRNVFAERQDGNMTLRRGFHLDENDTVLIVEDVVTTGGSVFEVIDIVKETGAKIAGVGLVVDRSNGKIDFGVKKHAVATMEVISFTKEECPLCKENVPINKPGSRNITK